MIHGDGSHGSPGLVDEAATCSRRRTDTHRPLESGYLLTQAATQQHERGIAHAQATIVTGRPSDYAHKLMVQSGCTPSS